MARVQVEERERINKFSFQSDAKSALVSEAAHVVFLLTSALCGIQVGRLLLRAAVVQKEGVRNIDVLFGRSGRGKPELVSPVLSP